MTQYLVTTFKDSIGHVHPHVTVAKPNQTYQVVEAESKEEAERKANNHLKTNKAIDESVDWLNKRLMERSILSKRQRKKWYKKHYGKDSE